MPSQQSDGPYTRARVIELRVEIERLKAAITQIAEAREDMAVSQHRESWESRHELVHLEPAEWADLDAAITAAVALTGKQQHQ